MRLLAGEEDHLSESGPETAPSPNCIAPRWPKVSVSFVPTDRRSVAHVQMTYLHVPVRFGPCVGTSIRPADTAA